MRSNWEKAAADELRALLRAAGMSYSDLANALNLQGEALNAATLTKRLYRGTFTHAFFLECEAVIGRRGEARGREALKKP